LWILISFAVPLLSAVFIWKQVQGNQYIFFCLPFIIVLISSGIFFVYEFLRNNTGRNAQIVSLAALVFLIIAVPNLMYFFGNDTTYKRNTDEVADYRKVFSYLKKHKSEGDVVITRNFRNYYMKDFGIKVYDFGGERAKEDLSLAQVEKIVNENPRGWVVIFDNDSIFMSKQAKEFIESKMTKVDSSLVRGASKMYTWNNIQSSQNEISSEKEL